MNVQGLLRVVVADDDDLVREALAQLVADDPGMTVVGLAADVPSAVRAAERLRPDIVLLDVKMPGGGGAHAARLITECAPASRIVAVSAYGDRATVLELLEAGACGYIVKGSSSGELLQGIRNVADGHAALSSDVTTPLLDNLTMRLRQERRERNAMHSRRERIRTLLHGPQMSIVYQPIVELATLHTVGHEALSRFAVEPRRPPDHWFAEARSVGLGEELEMAAVRRALAGYGGERRVSHLSVNVSPATVQSAELAELVALPRTFPVALEITEHTCVEDYDELLRAIDPYRHAGVKLSIDDAGSGYASLRHIIRLRPDIVKLDITLTRGIDTDPTLRTLARALIALAGDLQATVVAEGIETRGELAVLRDLGVPWGQGYQLGRPAAL